MQHMPADIAASRLLTEHWDRGARLDQLPEAIRPASRAEGYAIQARLEERSATPLFGWKIAATSAAGQAHIGVDGPLAGRLLTERVIPNGGECPFGTNHMRVAEIEFAFRMGDTLPPRAAPYSMDEVLAAVATLHPSIEIPDSRFDVFERVGAPQLIADNACAHYFVEGPAAPNAWRDLDLATYRVLGSVNGTIVEGTGSNVLGDPRVALQWLVNELSQLGIPLVAGQLVTTGTCVIPMAIAPGDCIQGDFGALGTVSVWMATT
jgi:2-keto-4-pentenoate hydratase